MIAMNMTETRILLADDHSLRLERLRRALQRQPGMTVVGKTANGRLTIEQVRELSPHVVIMNAHHELNRRLATVRRILAVLPDVRIIVLSADSSLPVVTEALRAGAAGYVIRGNDSAELVRAIRSVMSRRTYFCQEILSVVIGVYLKMLADKPAEFPRPLLADDERWMIKLIAEGKRNNEIAVMMGIRTNTVGTRRSRLMNKLNCSSTNDLVRYAFRKGIVSLQNAVSFPHFYLQNPSVNVGFSLGYC